MAKPLAHVDTKTREPFIIIDGAAQDWVGTSTRHITIGGGR